MASADKVTYEVRDRVAYLTLNEPQVLNRIDHGPGSIEECLLARLGTAEDDPGVRCVVLTGAGRAFSSGGTAQGLPPGDLVRWLHFLDSNAKANRRVRESRKPVIGAINGMCLGAGLTLATHLDFLVAHETATFGLIETRFGSTGAQMLPYLVGPAWARFLAITGEIITARTAKEIGLVIDVLPEDRFWPKVVDLARRVAAMPPEAVEVNRRVIDAAMNVQGWQAQAAGAAMMNTVANAVSHQATNVDGLVLSEVFQQQGWQAYKAARDGAFEPPWLDQ